jgi:two-component system chemotaxis sensor kinase CheA
VVQWVDDSIGGISQSGTLSENQAAQAPRLLRILSGEMTESPDEHVTTSPFEVPEWAMSLRKHLPGAEDHADLIAIRYAPHPECFFNGDDPLATMAKLPNLRHLAVSLKEPSPSLETYDPFRCHLVIEALAGGTAAEAQAIFRLIPDQVEIVPLPTADQEKPTASAKDSNRPTAAERSTTMRVDAARIDKLVEIVGELIVAKSGLLPLAAEARSKGDASLSRRILTNHDEIERLVGSLYAAVTQARMIPLEQTFRRFPRLVRDTAGRLGKAVDLVINGDMVEADREIVESLFEPLLHLVRNALDHGFETESDRLQVAKPARGRLNLSARQRGDQIEIEVADDGRGIDPHRIRELATERGLITSHQAAALSDEDVLQLIFAAGFSTTSSVSDLSGRGIGLDAVQNSIKVLGGTVELRSVAGEGTSFMLKLPISFSLTQLMIVEVGSERYGVAMADVIETHRLPRAAIQSVRAGEAFVLRDRTIPLLDLRSLLQLPPRQSVLEDVKVLIMQAGEEKVAIAVDAIAERSQTLTRPLAGLLHGIHGISGTTLMGDGRVLLVLDIEELIR